MGGVARGEVENLVDCDEGQGYEGDLAEEGPVFVCGVISLKVASCLLLSCSSSFLFGRSPDSSSRASYAAKDSHPFPP